MIVFNKKYFLLSLLLFLVEVGIALYIKDDFIRPYLGDVLVVILIYTFIKTFFDLSVLKVAVLVLLFSFSIEFLQYLKIVERLHLQDSVLARTILGTSFEWLDLLAYLFGIVIVILAEGYFGKGTRLYSPN